MSTDPQADALSALGEFSLREANLGATLVRLTESACEAIHHADIATLTVLTRTGEPATPYFTDELAQEVDEAQYVSGRGPCLEAVHRGHVVRLDDVAAETDRYPEFARTATVNGIASTLSVPMLAGDGPLGSLNLYAEGTAAFDGADEARARAVVAPISSAVANAATFRRAVERADQLQEAMRSRAVIEQAKGMIMAATGCDAGEAFDLLREQSQAENRKLRDIAEQVVRQRSRRR